ncbi:UNVERIFIED_CONTAM: hypothetical protein NY603_42165, partial [Bacteroidetes bacterium 56_B9]
MGAGATPPEGFDAMLKRDESRAVGGPGGGGVGQPGVLEAKPISEDRESREESGVRRADVQKSLMV